MKRKFNPAYSVLYAIQGAIVGIGAILPGISGGVLCVAFGVFEPIMELLTHPKQAMRKHKELLLPFIVGWAVGFVLLAGVVKWAYELDRDVANFIFFGLVLGTVPDLFKKSEGNDPKANANWSPFVISLSVSYIFFHIIEGGEAIDLPENFLTFAFCGALWGLSLIIPGLQSSTTLQFFGLFEPLMDGIASFDIGVLVPYLLGIVAVVIMFAKLVNMLFKRHYTLISRIILGFVISTSLKILPNSFENVWRMILALVGCVLGFIIAYFMDKLEMKGDKHAENTAL